MTERLACVELLELAASALGRVDRDGIRGITMLSLDQIEAMAVALVLLGLVPIPPGAPVPDRLIITSERTLK